MPEPLTVTESNATYTVSDKLFSLDANSSGRIPRAYFSNTEISVTSTNASGYVIFAKCQNGYVIMNGAQKFYYIPNSATSSGSAKAIASLHLDSIITSPVKFAISDENNITITGEIADYSFTAEGFAATLQNAGITDAFEKFVLGFARDIKADSATGLLATLGYIIDKKIKMFIPQEKARPLTGKKISIIGDSISTFSGYMPSGYESHYPRETITDVSQTWWHLLCKETGATLLANASMTGSYVTGNSTSVTDALAACSDKRIADLASGTEAPDIVICFIGINDFGQNAHRPLGDYIGQSAIPSEGSITTFSDGYALMIKKIMSAYPNAKVYCCSLPETKTAGWDTDESGTFPCINNNGVALAAFNERIRVLCAALGAEFIDLHACGINYWNLDKFTHDGLHPNADGARLIKSKIKASLSADCQ